LEGPPKVEFPFRFEKILRNDIKDIINKEMNAMDPDLLQTEIGRQEIIKKLVIHLDSQIDIQYAYQRTVVKTYLDYFRSLVPEVKFNWQYEKPEFYYAVNKQDGKWIYYRSL